MGRNSPSTVPFDFDPTFLARSLDVAFLQNLGPDGTNEAHSVIIEEGGYFCITSHSFLGRIAGRTVTEGGSSSKIAG
jgi:hypothetical protein